MQTIWDVAMFYARMSAYKRWIHEDKKEFYNQPPGFSLGRHFLGRQATKSKNHMLGRNEPCWLGAGAGYAVFVHLQGQDTQPSRLSHV